MHRKFKKSIICLLFIIYIGAIAIPVFAQTQYGLEYATALNLGTRDLRATAMQVVNILLGFLGIIFIAILLYGGYLYMTSRGAADKVERAKKVLINGCIGLALILSSYAIAYFVISYLASSTGVFSGCNNNTICEAGETCSNCPADCGACPPPPPPIGASFAVSWVDPANGEANVSLCRLIQMKFNNQIDPTTITAPPAPWGGNVTVNAATVKGNVNLWVEVDGGAAAGNPCVANDQCASGVCSGTCQGDLVPGEITMWPNSLGLTFNNTNDFEINTDYKVTIKSDAIAPNGLENTSGSRLTLGDYSWTFTTGALTDTVPPKVSSLFPSTGDVDICLTSPIEAIFNEPMDISSLLATDPVFPMDPSNKNSIYVNPAISGFNKSVSGVDTLIARSKDPFTAATTYSAVLDSDVIRDSCGNYLDGDGDGVSEFSAGGDDYPPAGSVELAFYDADGAAAGDFANDSAPGVDGGNNVYVKDGADNYTITSSNYISVDTTKHYRVSGKFKSMGAPPLGIGVLSKIYFGLVPYDATYTLIEAWKVLRRGSNATITAFNATSITTNETLTGWSQPPVIAGERSLGFYYSGDTNHLPDYVYYYYPAPCVPPIASMYYCTNANKGAYNSAVGNTISLNNPLPAPVTASLVPGVTAVKEHYSGGTYMYSSAGFATVPDTWTSYPIPATGGVVTGEAFGNSGNIFRPDTKYVKILILGNYQQTANEKLYFDDILFEEIPSWGFTTGNNTQCIPEITSITPAAGNYNDESGAGTDKITISGNYFTSAGNLIFNNSVDVPSTGTNSCMLPIAGLNYIPDQGCVISWADHKIEVRVPAQSGASNGASTGNIAVEIGAGNYSNAMAFTVDSPHIDYVWPNQGGTDQFVTISGSGFGAAQGPNDHVYFRRDEDGDTDIELADPAELVEANYPCAGSVGWNDEQIIISVPDNVSFTDGEDWYIQVVRDQTTNKYWGNLTNFKFIDVVPGPGLCSALNQEAASPYFGLAEGMLDDTVQFSGVRFQDINLPVEQEVNFGNYTSYVSAKSIAGWAYGPPDTVNGDVPNVSEGKVGVYLKVDGKNSNTLNFKVHTSATGPQINYFDPISGAVGEYITIYGSNFSTWDGGVICNVQFSNGGGGWVDGDFNFPEKCGNNFWSNTQIIVKVPAGAATGNIKVTTRESLTDDTSDLSPANFTVNPGPAGPGICGINPKAGPVGISVDVFGERLTGVTDVKFFNNKSAMSYTAVDDKNIESCVSPNATTPSDPTDDAVSGPITVEAGAQISNGYNFKVSDCREPGTGCGDIGYPGYECCYDGSCMDPAGGGCKNPSKATYSWNFSTGTYTTCSGYSLDQCMATNTCPNSPGLCSSSPAQTGADTGSDCGDQYCNNTFSQCKFTPDCKYGNTENICELDGVECNISSGLAGSEVAKTGDQETSRVGGCFVELAGNYLGSCSNMTATYNFNLSEAGHYIIDVQTANYGGGVLPGLDTFNSDAFCPASGIQHHVIVSIDGTQKGEFCNDAWPDFDIKTGNVDLGYITAGSHTVTLQWNNDWSAGGRDSNVRFHNITISQRPVNLTCREKTWGTYPRAGYWKFDETDNSLTTVYDSSGNGNDGTRVGTTRVDGRFNNALNFPGTINDYVVKNPINGFPDKEITIEFWMKTSDAIKDGTPISYATAANSNEFLIYNYKNFDLQINGVSTGATGISANDNEWHHIAVTWRSSDGKLILYKDGLSVYNATLKVGYSIVAGGALVIGNEQDSVGGGFEPSQAFLGSIDEVAIYDRALSGGEVMAKYVSGSKDYVWQYPIGSGCNSGSFQDTNGYCTAGSVAEPLLCAGCQNGFSCNSTGGGNGICAINQNICPSGSTCAPDIDLPADGLDDCVGDVPGQCECCCRVGHSDTDCCSGLTCEDLNCGTDDATYTYGYCTGCAVWDSGTFFQSLSDDSCGCINSNRICIADELLAPPPGHDPGFCGDCLDVNSITFDSDDSGAFVSPDDIRHECQSHGSCCWNSLANSCYTCDTLEVVEEICSPISSPSPQKDETEACLNSAVYVKFNLEIDPLTLPGGIEVYECTDGVSCAAPVPVLPEVGFPQLVGLNNELQFIPAGGLFNMNTWYKVIINRNLRDLNGLNLKRNYQWYFKTKAGTDSCSMDGIIITPKDEIITTAFDTRVYSAVPMIDCIPLNPFVYNWVWQSSDTSIATITNNDVMPNFGLTDPQQTATAQDKDGSTKIMVSVPTDSKQAETNLFVILEDPKVTDYWPNCKEACLNAAMGAKFNMSMDPATLNLANIGLYKWHCGNKEIEIGEDCDDGNTISGDGCSATCLKEGNAENCFTETSGLVSNWAFDDGIGNTAKDSAGSNDGNLNAPDWTTGKFGGGLYFNGTNDYVEMNAPISTNSPFTISMWYYPTRVNVSYDMLYSGTDNADLQLFFQDATKRLRTSVENVEQESSFTLNAGNINQWHHIIWSYDYVNNKVWVDGTQVLNVPQNTAFTKDDISIRIGETLGGAYPIEGIIDDVRIYDVAVTDAQVQNIDYPCNAPCGDGVVQNNEECDGIPFPQGCSLKTCTHTGSVVGLSICGDGKVTEGEDCDDGNAVSGDGCSNICLNEGTVEFTPVVLGSIAPNFDNTIVDINLPAGSYFDPNTYYRAFLFNGIRGGLNQKQLAGLNWDFDKNGEYDSFSWSFKTKDDFCSPDTVQVKPEQKVIYSINATQDYEAGTYGSPDSCNPLGQKLNPYSYNWSWLSAAPQIADFIAPFPANLWPGCGNGKVETGEDCDDNNNLSGDGCSSVCTNEGTTQNMGLVSQWELNEGSDVFAHDSAGVNDGNIINGPLWTTGKFGGALDFDGAKSQYVDVGDVFAAPQTELTVSAWVFVDRFSNVAGKESTPIVSGWNNWNPPSQKGFLLRTYYNAGPGTIYWDFIICDNNASYHQVSYDTLPFNDFNTKYAGQWLHIAGTYRPGANNLKFYINGRNASSVAGSAINMTPDIASSVWIGRTGINPNYFNGIIDDVRIYNKSLTGAQIQGIMKQKNYLCGNGVIDFGEDCDGDPFPAGCDINSCLHTGSIMVCGNGIVETGEDCDDGNAVSGDGCSNVCLHEGTETDAYIDFYQTATTKSPGKTNIEASVNYCSDDPTVTCGGALPACATGACKQTTGSSDLEVVCGFSNDDSCGQGVCAGGFCTNNSTIPCTVPTEAADCNLTAVANTTCNFSGSNHTCPINIWGGTCSVSGDICYSASDCSDTEFCQPHADCNYCANNTSFECRTAHNLVPGPGNSDCQLGVGYDSCCYSRPIIESQAPDPDFFDPLTNPLALNCNNNATPLDGTDDYCSAFGVGAACQTYTCQDTNSDSTPDTCSAYGRCNNANGLIGHWRLDESPAVNGNTIFDSSSSGINGTLSTGDAANKSAIGEVSGALNFDGTDDHIVLPNGFSDFTNGFSVSVWAYPIAPAANWQRFIDFGNGAPSDNILFARNGSSNNLTLEVYNAGASMGKVTATNAIEFNKWQHFVATISNAKQVQIYKNGVVVAAGSIINMPQNLLRANNYIGRSNWPIAIDKYYKGMMDDVRIYNRELSEDEVANLYNSHCLNNNDCAADSTCDKTCRDNSQCNDIACGACRNAQVNITFDKIMDPASFASDGVCSNNSSQKCSQDSNCSGGVCLKNIRLGVRYDDAAINQKNCPSGSYAEDGLVYNEPKGLIARFIAKVKNWVNKILGRKETIAAEYWCAIPGTITSFNSNNRTTAIFTPQGLKDNLFEDGVTYRVTVKHGVKRAEGVSMGKDDPNDFQYEFKAGDIECNVESVDVYVGD